MSALFEFTLESETLSSAELVTITGHPYASHQARWLAENHWTFHKNKAGEPIVGRLYARLKLAGINPAQLANTNEGWTPDFSSIN